MSDWRDWPDGEVQHDGMPIHYYRTGDPTKPAVVMLHGFTDFGLCWAPVAAALANDYDLIMIDAIGHGRSGGTERGFRERAVGDVLAVIDALGLHQPVLLGHSMGAGTAAGVAATAPDKIRAVILEDPGWRDTAQPMGNDNLPATPADSSAPLGSPPWLTWIKGFKALSPEERYAQTAQERPDWSEAERLPWADAKALLNLGVFDSPRIVGNLQWRDTAAKITCPVLLLTADPARGGIVTPEVAADAQQHLKQGQVVNFPTAGHNIRRAAFPDFVTAVRRFLQEVTA